MRLIYVYPSYRCFKRDVGLDQQEKMERDAVTLLPGTRDQDTKPLHKSNSSNVRILFLLI